MNCNKCQKPIEDGADESCWFCDAPLCFDCWDAVGHCGHELAEAINEATADFNRVWDETGDKWQAIARYQQVMTELGFK